MDEFTRTDYPDGQFKDAGPVHFSSEAELYDLFSYFDCLMLTRRETHYIKPDERIFWISPQNGDVYVSSVFDMVWKKR